MIGWIIFAAYAVGYVLCWRTVCWYIASEISGGGKVPADAAVGGLIAGSCFTVMWPAIGFCLIVRRLPLWRNADITLALAPRHEKRRLKLDERERRIRNLERELGIKEPVA